MNIKLFSRAFTLAVLTATCDAGDSQVRGRGGLRNAFGEDGRRNDFQKHRGLNIYSSLRWKERVDGRVIVPYSINESFSAGERDMIRSALSGLEESTGSIQFIERSNEGHYILVVRDPNADGCFSPVGMKSGGQMINLDVGCMAHGIIQHEFIHALGLTHEQNRPDRDDYVIIYFDNIADRREKEHNFHKADYSETLGSPYDYGSIMHYGSTAFALAGQVTIEPIQPHDGIEIGQRDGVSSTDVNKLKLLYQCDNVSVRQWDDLINNRCTSDCKCREGENGCGDNDDACHGSLICSDNTCVVGSSESLCGCSSCNQNIWDNTVATNDSGSYSCGERITWLIEDQGYSTHDACMKVANEEFPDVCSPCDPTKCSGTTSPPTCPSPVLLWQVYPGGSDDEDFRCIDVMAADTTNGNLVWYYKCNFTPAQYWYWDPYNGDHYMRSSIDKGKCLITSGGSTELGTRLIIHDCFENDQRFVWDYYEDGSIRPRNNNAVCIEISSEDTGTEDSSYLILGECHEQYKSFSLLEGSSSGRRKLTRATPKVLSIEDEDIHPRPMTRSRNRIDSGKIDFSSANDCEDSPVGWYDIFGRNCHWYEEDASNCEVYGSQYKNFGKTAMSACCACGGGSGGDRFSSNSTVSIQTEVMSDSQVCWDVPNWYDSTGDGCLWYQTKDNGCSLFGSQFPNTDGLTANDACCGCGGGLSQAPSSSEEVVDPPSCSDDPFNWFDEKGLGCDWYSNEDRNCVEFGGHVGFKGLTANEACCVCGGGFDPLKL